MSEREKIIEELKKEGWVSSEEIDQRIKDIMFYMYDIEEVCPSCSGRGKRGYADTSTWHGGIGGQAITTDICDKCWGSGDLTHKGVNLRHLNSILTDAQRERLRKANA